MDTEFEAFSMRMTGLEPVRDNSHAPQTCAYASSATSADSLIIIHRIKINCQEVHNRNRQTCRRLLQAEWRIAGEALF